MRAAWKRKSLLCEADQLTPENIPQGIDHRPLGVGSDTCYTFMTPFGRVLVPMGTWVVYDEEGARVVPREVFERTHVPLSIAGRAVAVGRRAAQKIIGPRS